MKILITSYIFDNEIGILSVDLDKIDLDDVNFHEDDTETINHV